MQGNQDQKISHICEKLPDGGLQAALPYPAIG